MAEPTNDAEIRRILTETRTIALVGASPKPERDSHEVMAFLQSRGYRVIPVNPACAGQTILGERVRASLAEIEEPIDLVDVFRNSEAAGAVADEAIAAKAQGRVDAARRDQRGRRGARARRGARGRDGPLPEDRDPPAQDSAQALIRWCAIASGGGTSRSRCRARAAR